MSNTSIVIYCASPYKFDIFFSKYSYHFYSHVCRAEWLKLIETHQSGLIPLDAVKKSKTWFEYIFNEASPKESRYRCRICNKHYDELNLPSNHRSLLADKDGMLRKDKAQNRRNILEHATKPGHMKVIEILERKMRKR